MRGFVTLAVLLAPLAAAQATESDIRTVAAMKGHARVLISFAPTLQDQRLEQQRGEMARFALGAAQRDVSFIQVDRTRVLGARDTADQLRAQFRVPADAYRTLLIGKDGQVIVTSEAPLAADRIAQTIDAQPERQEEVRRARAGQPLQTKP